MRLWVTAGGTGSAWHICSIAKKYYSDEIEIFVSDINDEELVAASVLADHFFKVPRVDSEGYAENMYKLLSDNAIDVIIPLIPWEQNFFAPDNESFAKLGIISAAAKMAVNDLLNNKENLFRFCNKNDIATIANISFAEIDDNKNYFVKPKEGFGAMKSFAIEGSCVTRQLYEDNVIQENCSEDGELNEVTAEVFNADGKCHVIVRRRLEAKSGVCTKAEILKSEIIENTIEQIVGICEMPCVFNIQFVYHKGLWKVMDVNLRLAAGTGLSNAAGFQLIRAYLAALLGKNIENDWFNIDYGIRKILRVYDEVVIR